MLANMLGDILRAIECEKLLRELLQEYLPARWSESGRNDCTGYKDAEQVSVIGESAVVSSRCKCGKETNKKANRF